MAKLTYENQGFWDRLQRAGSWISRSETFQEWDDYHGPFISYWIAFNALYGRHDEIRGRKDIDDIEWFLSRICELDQEDGSLSRIMSAIKQKTDRLLRDQFLSEIYWKEGLSSHFKRRQDEDLKEARTAYNQGKLAEYLTILFKRLQVLRNQVFHGCSTDKKSLNKNSLRPALEILEELVPHFWKIFKAHGQRYDWPKVPYPRRDSPHHQK